MYITNTFSLKEDIQHEKMHGWNLEIQNYIIQTFGGSKIWNNYCSFELSIHQKILKKKKKKKM